MNHPDVFQQCLTEVEAGRATPAECAAQYPAEPDLEQALTVALRLRRTAWPTLSPQAQHQIEARLHAHLATHPIRLTARERALRWWMGVTTLSAKPTRAFMGRWVSAMLVAALLFSGLGTLSASAASWPGETLYSVKRAGETMSLLLTPHPDVAYVRLSLAHRRSAEMVALFKQKKFDLGVVEEFNRAIALALIEVDDAPLAQQPRLLRQTLTLIDLQTELLTAIQTSAPPATQAALTQAARALTVHRQTAQTHLTQALRDVVRTLP